MDPWTYSIADWWRQSLPRQSRRTRLVRLARNTIDSGVSSGGLAAGFRGRSNRRNSSGLYAASCAHRVLL